jgi:nucleotide-binding universal stress UspA family protein
MTFVVAFDGSPLAEAALRRGVELGDAVGEPVVAVSVVPRDSLYARQHGWVDDERAYDPAEQAERLRQWVADLAPEAEFRVEELRGNATQRDVAKQIRRAAYDLEATVVVIGSENAGRVFSPISSVGNTVASSEKYDVFIVRDADR